MKRKKVLFRYLAVTIASLLLLFQMIGCKASYDSGNELIQTDKKNTADTQGYDNYDDSAQEAASDKEESDSAGFNRKLIFTASMDIETLDYDKSISDFEALVDEYEGFIQDSRIESSSGINAGKDLRSASFKVRIPSDKLNAFRKAAGDIGTITLNTVSGDDVTDQYYDTKARLNTLQVQEERLLALLEKAEELKDIIELEDRLSELRYEIENFTGNINKLDALVEMSTVNVDITEVKTLTEPEPENFGQQIAVIFTASINALVSTLKQIALGLVAVFPFLIVFGGIALVIILLSVRSSKRKRRQREAELEALRSGLGGKKE